MTDITAGEDGLNVIELTQGAGIQVTCLNPDRKIKFPFGVITADKPLKDNRKRLLVSDFKSHSVMEIDEDGLELMSLLGSIRTQDLMMDQHKVDFSTLMSELHAEDRLFISLSIPLIVEDPYDCFNI